jgi:crotonobetainyl-CoA:carnitine CoA-transferase CaiB-like acyl-CoA transferase
MVRMPAFGLDGPWRDRTGFAQTMEAVTGLAWRTGYEDDLPTLILGACDPVAGMHAVMATLLALRQRDSTGTGSLVESVMVEAALNIAAESLVEFSASNAEMSRHGNRSLLAAPQGVYPCTGDDQWIALSVATNEQWRALTSVVNGLGWGSGPEFESLRARAAAHDRIDEDLVQWTSSLPAQAIVDLLSAAGIPCEIVIPARDVVKNPQLEFRGLFEMEDHPVTGRHPIPTLPFRMPQVASWLRSASPTLGQHNDEVLSEIGLDESARGRLRQRGVIGDRLSG